MRNRKKISASFYSEKDKRFEGVELYYSCLSYPRWFCRIWKKNWLRLIEVGIDEYKEGEGRTKFEAYRNAMASSGSLKSQYTY